MRITYSRDHVQGAYIIQIVIPDSDILPLPLTTNLPQATRGSFIKLSEQLILLAKVAEELEAPFEEEEDFMADFLEKDEELEMDDPNFAGEPEPEIEEEEETELDPDSESESESEEEEEDSEEEEEEEESDESDLEEDEEE